ncbi:MAG TPA: class I SAM-dependent methyltransferase [Chitinophagaceae bacterium]
MNTEQAYNSWASQYDTNENKTRDLEALSLRTTVSRLTFNNCLEIGCGTGKNTSWLVDRAEHVTAVDFSGEMLAKAKEKVDSKKVSFVQADITKEWLFGDIQYDLITFSLVLEHISGLDHIFSEASKKLVSGGHIYIGELHPFKQYSGSKARFDTADGVQIVECFNHNISEFIQTARKYGLTPVDVNEYFDDDARNSLPRILMILLRK